MKKIRLIILAGIFSVALLGCQPWTQQSSESFKASQGPQSQSIQKNEVAKYKIEPFVSGLEVPWDMVFTSSERMLITERPGRIRVVENGELKSKPLYTFSNTSQTGEEGLMSIALDPDYQKNQWIYVSLAYQWGKGMKVKILRFKDGGDHLEDETVIFDDLPAARYHAGCRLAFGPDGKLYVTVGDALEKKQAQNVENLFGKILRLNKDGSIPDDNPFPGSPIWSYGHRNSQGIAWHPETKLMYETEHGPSVIDGPPGGDEVNQIIKGGNYGWPLVSHGATKEGVMNPLMIFTPAEAPASLLIYSGKAFPQFKYNLFFGALVGKGLVRLELDPEHPDQILKWEKLVSGQYGRIRTVMEGPEGYIYFSTSNWDGRGRPQEGDDKIYRMIPKE